MAMLTPRAAAAISEAACAAQVPGLRARASRGGAPTAADYGGTAAIVETEPARRRGAGEVAVTRGAACVYLPAALLEAYPDIVLDLHAVPRRPDRPGQPEPPTLRLRPPARPQDPGAAGTPRG
ncbi:hypothetical protein LQ327_09430 [Actinomycetospora endophytica]|uniref:LysR substrate binding domain-containing protein n=1 Tax=Actinomycetospora endophytica TaxID=2291215 RepID=A0ABS8P871_9PSEU|nr:hypothetical protein [Actinomycetospora endophytica]MCD2193601.1 hypothetical protein [Actinomycetospora endophytica]